jgi:heme O synthase-like polyprenyltransferase
MSEAVPELLVTAVARDRGQVVSDLVALTKPRVLVMVLVTTLVGYDAGLTGRPDYVRMLHLLIGTLLAAGGTLALNQHREREVDARMERTRTRPLPDGRLQPLEALFGILFLWQLPHTLSIASLYRDAYARAGVRVLPVLDPSGASTGRQIVVACFGLLAVSLLPPVIGWTGPLYLAGALVLGLAFAAVGMLQALAPSPRSARQVLLASLLYLPLLLGMLAFDKV